MEKYKFKSNHLAIGFFVVLFFFFYWRTGITQKENSDLHKSRMEAEKNTKIYMEKNNFLAPKIYTLQHKNHMILLELQSEFRKRHITDSNFVCKRKHCK